jgi:hypothetical protein
LFDAGGDRRRVDRVTYEGQAAVQLEWLAAAASAAKLRMKRAMAIQWPE